MWTSSSAPFRGPRVGLRPRECDPTGGRALAPGRGRRCSLASPCRGRPTRGQPRAPGHPVLVASSPSPPRCPKSGASLPAGPLGQGLMRSGPVPRGTARPVLSHQLTHARAHARAGARTLSPLLGSLPLPPAPAVAVTVTVTVCLWPAGSSPPPTRPPGSSWTNESD